MGIQSQSAQCLRWQPSFSRIDKSPRFFFIALACLATVFVISAVFYINTHVRVVELGYDITQAMAQKQELMEKNKQLSLKIAQLKAPARLEEVARAKLSLNRPQNSQLLRLSQLKTWHQAKEQVASKESSSPTRVAQKDTAKKSASQASVHKNPQNLVIAQAKTHPKVSSQVSGAKMKEVPSVQLDTMP